MKRIIVLALMLSCIYSCKKDKKSEPEPVPETPANVDNYSSLEDFYLQNGVQTETFSINAGTGGIFKSAKGTTVNIPANAFSPSTANIVFKFRDIYKKSDMLLSNVGTSRSDGAPLVSGGEFNLSTGSGDSLLAGKKIDVIQPSGKTDKDMTPFVAGPDVPIVWSPPPLQTNTVIINPNTYIYQIASLTGSNWYNTDHPLSPPPFVQLTIHALQSDFNPAVCLVYKNFNACVRLYTWSGQNYNYSYSIAGAELNVVALAIKDGKVYSSIVPLTASASQTVNFTLSETTTENFKSALRALD